MSTQIIIEDDVDFDEMVAICYRMANYLEMYSGCPDEITVTQSTLGVNGKEFIITVEPGPKENIELIKIAKGKREE